jgi:hypothetical protein
MSFEKAHILYITFILFTAFKSVFNASLTQFKFCSLNYLIPQFHVSGVIVWLTPRS